MSVVTLQLGQCGNQIGGQFFSTLADDLCNGPDGRFSHSEDSYKETCTDRFFSVDSSGKWNARAVMVDMEQKVYYDLLLLLRLILVIYRIMLHLEWIRI